MEDPIALGDVARRLGCSASYLTREFRRRTGVTPVRYLTGLRTRRAAYLLETTDLPAREIARLTGYSDPSFFSRVFRRVMGRSPRQWRRDRSTK
jgi:AraC-like DNA-binding protein